MGLLVPLLAGVTGAPARGHVVRGHVTRSVQAHSRRAGTAIGPVVERAARHNTIRRGFAVVSTYSHQAPFGLGPPYFAVAIATFPSHALRHRRGHR